VLLDLATLAAGGRTSNIEGYSPGAEISATQSL
jgi:hypothetical protein